MVRPRSRRLYRLAIAMSLLSLALGTGRLLAERDPRPSVFWQIVFPLLVLGLALAMYRRSRDS